MKTPPITGQLDASALEARTQALGRELYASAMKEHAHLSSLNRWTKQVLRWCLSDPQVKASVLRFIDCLPSLRSPDAVVRHLRDYFPTTQLRLPTALRVGVALSGRGLLTARAASFAVHQVSEQMARQFIAGTTIDDAVKLLTQAGAKGLGVSIDVLGEQVLSDDEAEAYASRYAALIDALSQQPPVRPDIHPTVHVSIKPSSLTTHFDPLSAERGLARAVSRLRPLTTLAVRVGAAITLDMEQYELRDLTIELAKRLLLDADGGAHLRLGVVIQAYLRDSDAVVERLLAWLAQAGRQLDVRLVKGAYWDYEVALAKQRGWEIPVYREKWETDAAFERLTQRLLEAGSVARPAIASHNLRSIAHAMAVVEACGRPQSSVEFQVLYGMADAIQAVILQAGYPVRLYTPIGELIPGMAYLVRRVLENTANESFLRQDLWEGVSVEALLQSPAPKAIVAARIAQASEVVAEPFANFVRQDERDAFGKALKEIRETLDRRYPLLIGSQEVMTGRWMVSVNPAHPEQLVGQVAEAGPQETELAISMAASAQPRWAARPVAVRVDCLRRAAELLRTRRRWFAALEVLEVGKTWREADADVVEAIDYLEYYGAQMLELAAGKPLAQRPGESNRYVYVPRGVCAVIAPWNFPLAILTGMASAALAAGNVVILKPAEQSPVIAYHLTRLLREAGIPPDVAQYLPGPGEIVGSALARHPRVHGVLFTGSKPVGLSLIQTCTQVSEGQRFMKHVILEMGGKNAIIVDEDADVDHAITGILASAFGYAGQKCSAASRVIVHDAVYEELMERLVGAARDVVIGDPADPGTDLGPLIDDEAQRRVIAAVEEGSRQAQVLYRCLPAQLPQEGYYVGPTILAEVDPKSPLAQEELFGPVLCVFRARSFEQALSIANDSAYGLTGGVYSRSPSHLEEATRAFEVGNLYLNRPITGAIVGRQPFGGYKLSGLGTKAGGPDYLLQLLLPKTICENTARHGIPLE